jgi:hypothetical protein
MKPEIENLKVWMSGKITTGYQRALAMREFEQLLSYVDELEKLSQPLVSGSLRLVDFIKEIEYMQGLYSNKRYTQAEATRDKLAEQLDDLMRLGSNDR